MLIAALTLHWQAVFAAPRDESDDSSSGHVSEGEASGSDGDSDRAAAAAAAPAVRAWWSSMFVLAGKAGSGRKARKGAATAGKGDGEQKKRINTEGFLEEDQEALYTQAQLGRATGKSGLGQGSQPKKVAGARWAGTKTKIGSDSDGDEGDDEGEEGSSGDDEGVDTGDASYVLPPKANGGAVVLPPKSQQQQQQQPEPASAAGAKRRRGGDTEVKAKDQTQQGEEEGGKVKGRKDKSKGKDRSKKARREGGGGEDANGSAAAEEAPRKLHKLAHKLLAVAPKQRLKLHRLRAEVYKAAGLPACEDDLSRCRLMKKLRAKPELFGVCEKYVRLLGET
jgi:Pin2-interacting protein X1